MIVFLEYKGHGSATHTVPGGMAPSVMQIGQGSLAMQEYI